MPTTTHAESDLTYWTDEYWLGHCEGFRVDSPEGRVGIVEAIMGPQEEPTALAVRGGLFTLRTVYVPVDDVVSIDPPARRIVLRSNLDLRP